MDQGTRDLAKYSSAGAGAVVTGHTDTTLSVVNTSFNSANANTLAITPCTPKDFTVSVAAIYACPTLWSSDVYYKRPPSYG